MRYFIFVFLLLFFSVAIAQELTLEIPRPSSDSTMQSSYFPEQALRLSLLKTESEGKKAILKYVENYYSADRLRSMLIHGQGLDVMWSNVSIEREKSMLSVAFNVYSGLNEYKLLVVRRESLPFFKELKSVEQLREMKIGIGSHWLDARIFSENSFDVVTSTNSKFLYKMLKLGRFDVLPRSAHEILSEQEIIEYLDLEVVENISLHYCLPVHFYVNKNNGDLATRIENGLKLALNDGSLRALYESVPSIKHARAVIDTHKETIELINSECVVEENWY